MNKKCNACGSISYKDISLIITQGDRGDIKWLICNDCNSFFSTQIYDKQEEIDHTSNYTSWGDEVKGKLLNNYKLRMFESIARIVYSFKSPPAYLLDIGCSYGGFLSQMKKIGYNVEGFDIVAKAIDFVKQNNFNAQVCFSIIDTNYEERSFDIISVLDSNCYWNDQQKELNAIYQKLKSDGILVMRVVDKSLYLKVGLILRLFNKKIGNRLLRYSVNDHYFSMPVVSLLAELKKIGFKILYSSPKGAIHSYKTNFFVKVVFKLGELVYNISGIFIAPGAVIVAKKITRDRYQ